ncbi:MAG: hypothetical protein EPN72_03840 [Nevskiaceae bacterium]|nr:MAG: hypothetical protein EPN63_06620 [Nevskiaceae bacterium]TBR73954.1 MAG: hypothetical protein EPN72_03840 [Nevskiaceae bacterium]
MKPADASARQRALDFGRHVIAVAPAGSGKTGLLVQRFLAALATVDEPEQVVAITFTNKAAAEIRIRIDTLLQRAAAHASPASEHDATALQLAQAVIERDRAHGWNLTANPNRLQASTIDGFNNRIASELPLLSGIGGHAQVVDDAAALYEQAILDLFDDALGRDAPADLQAAAATWLRSVDNRIDRLLPPLVALLGCRDQWIEPILDAQPDDDAVLAALHRDAQQALLDALGPADAAELAELACAASAGDDKLVWAAELTGWPALGAENSDLHCKLAQLLVTQQGTPRSSKGINAKIGFPAGTPPQVRLKALLDKHADDIRLTAAARGVQSLPPASFPSTLVELRDDLRVLLRRLLAHLQVTMGSRGATDFNEIAARALRALRPDGSYGEALLKRDQRIRHLLVDEMQDTSRIQIELLKQLTQGWEPGDGHSLFLVGDPQQSIYAFRNARVTLFMELWATCQLGTLALERAQLTVNFRSTAPLVAWFNTTFQACFPAADNLTTGAVRYTPADTLEPPPAGSATDTAAWAFRDPAQEALAVADRVQRLVETAPGNSIALLARTRPQLVQTLAELRRRGVAYECQDIDGLADVPAVRDVLALAHALWHPQDRLYWPVVLRAPWVGLGWADLVALSAARRRVAWPVRLREAALLPVSPEGQARIARLLKVLDDTAPDATDAPFAERVEHVWLQLGGPACGDATALADVHRALQLLRRHAPANGFTDLRSFQRAVEQLYASPVKARVKVLTIHKAKGLEFDHVLLVGCGRKPRSDSKPLLYFLATPHGPLLVPKPPEHWEKEKTAAAAALFDYVHDLHKAAQDNESLRLLYVAATRARRSLHLYAALKENPKGEFKPTARSFAQPLWDVLFSLPFSALQSTPPPAVPATDIPALPPPRAPRLPLPFQLPAETDLFIPRERRTLRPSESLLSTRQDDAEEANLHARLIGTLYHQALQRIAECGISTWQAESTRHAPALAAGFRRLGLPEPQVDDAVTRVLDLVARTLDSAHGRWLLAQHPWAQAEYALSGYLDGEWVAAVIDRCFEDADGTLWVIDYKTTAHTIAAEEVAGYIATARQTYAPQLKNYAQLLGLHREVSAAVKTALYLAEPDVLVEI